MTVNNALRLMAGCVVLLSLALAYFVNDIDWVHSPNWLWLTAFAGLNLFQSGITGTCPMKWVFRKAGMKP